MAGQISHMADQPTKAQISQNGTSTQNGVRMRPAIAPRVTSLKPVTLAKRDDGSAQSAEGHRRGVGDQRQARSLQRTEAQTDQQRGGHGYRSAESRCALKECAEAEGDQQQLQATVLGDAGHALLQHFEASRLNRELVHEDDVQHDPADGEQAVAGAIDGRSSRQSGRHVEAEDRDQPAPSPVQAAQHSAPSRDRRPGCRAVRPPATPRSGSRATSVRWDRSPATSGAGEGRNLKNDMATIAAMTMKNAAIGFAAGGSLRGPGALPEGRWSDVVLMKLSPMSASCGQAFPLLYLGSRSSGQRMNGCEIALSAAVVATHPGKCHVLPGTCAG